MGREIFFKIFDGPQNIFLCSIFVILFFKFKGVGAQNIPTSKQRDVRKTRHVKKITFSQQIVLKANSVKNKKKFLMHFDPDARVFFLSN